MTDKLLLRWYHAYNYKLAKYMNTSKMTTKIEGSARAGVQVYWKGYYRFKNQSRISIS